MKKIALFLALVMVFAMAVPAFANPFSDVSTNHWAYDAIVKVLASGILDGYPDGTFKGNKAVSRYEIAVIVARILDNIAAEREALEAELEAEIDAASADADKKIEAAKVELEDVIKKMAKEGLSDQEAADVALMIRALTAGLKQELKDLGVEVADMEKALGEKIDALEARVAALEEPVYEWSASTAIDFHTIDYTGTPYVDPFDLQSDEDEDGVDETEVLFDTDEYFTHTFDLGFNANKDGVNVDMDLNAVTNLFGNVIDNSSSGLDQQFDIKVTDLSATVTSDKLTLEVGSALYPDITDYLYDSSDYGPFADGGAFEYGIGGAIVDSDYGYYALTRDDEFVYFGGTNTFDLAGQDIDLFVGIENQYADAAGLNVDDLDNADWVVGAKTTFDLGLFDTTFELATNDTEFDGRLFRINATGTVDPIDVTFNYKNIENFVGILSQAFDNTKGFDITGETEINVVDLALTYSDYVVDGLDDESVLFTAEIPATDADDNDVRPEFNGVKYSGSFTYEDILHLTEANRIEWNFEVEEDINVVNVVAGLDYGDWTMEYTLYDDSEATAENDWFDKYIDLTATLVTGLTGEAHYNFNLDNELDVHKYGLNYEQGIFAAGLTKDVIGDLLYLNASVDPEAVTVAGVNVDGFFEYLTETTNDVSYYGLTVDATKAVDEALTLNGSFVYGVNDGYKQFVESVEEGHDALDGTLIKWTAGAEYTFIEDLSATINYTNLDFDGVNTADSYEVQEVSAGLSYDF